MWAFAALMMTVIGTSPPAGDRGGPARQLDVLVIAVIEGVVPPQAAVEELAAIANLVADKRFRLEGDDGLQVGGSRIEAAAAETRRDIRVDHVIFRYVELQTGAVVGPIIGRRRRDVEAARKHVARRSRYVVLDEAIHLVLFRIEIGRAHV